MATANENTKRIKHAFDSLNKGDLTGVSALLGEDMQGVVKEVHGAARSAFPDLRITVEDTIACDDKVVTRWTAEGTHKGKGRLHGLGSIKPTGKPVRIEGITIHRLENGKIVETWGVTEKYEAMVDLGLISEQKQ